MDITLRLFKVSHVAELVVVCCWLGSWFWLYMTVTSEEFGFSGEPKNVPNPSNAWLSSSSLSVVGFKIYININL